LNESVFFFLNIWINFLNDHSNDYNKSNDIDHRIFLHWMIVCWWLSSICCSNMICTGTSYCSITPRKSKTGSCSSGHIRGWISFISIRTDRSFFSSSCLSQYRWFYHEQWNENYKIDSITHCHHLNKMIF
jgi:hypothetical protein